MIIPLIVKTRPATAVRVAAYRSGGNVLSSISPTRSCSLAISFARPPIRPAVATRHSHHSLESPALSKPPRPRNNVNVFPTIIKSSSLTCQMTTAYGGEPSDGTAGLSSLTWLPYQTTLPGCGRKIEVGPFKESEWQDGMDLMNLIIREGKSWPFEEEFDTVDAYRGYFLSHAASVVRSIDHGLDGQGRMSKPGTVLGAFYVKPNYPGRCSHICNGGFITNPNYRRMGVARLMGKVFLRAARDLGYKSSYFNLVFKSNNASVALWESLGFERVAVLENAARLEGVDGLDTAYGYRYDLETLDDDYLIGEKCL